LFDIPDPFFPLHRRLATPSWMLKVNKLPAENSYAQIRQKNDPHSTFDQFFKEN
jgi:hypothetical protein